MIANPTQLLTLALLGLVSACVLTTALYLLYRALFSRRLVVRETAGPAENTLGNPEASQVREVVERDSKRLLVKLAIPVLMLLLVFAGKYFVAPFFPAKAKTPALPQPASSTIEGASGATLAVSHYGSNEGPALVFTHGWGADWRDWQYLLSALPPHFNVVVWDLPGLGSSTPAHDYSMATLAADLDRVIATVQGRPVILVGHSVGGILNLEYARRYPHKLQQQVRGIAQLNTTYTNPLRTKKNAELSLKLQKPLLEPLMHLVVAGSPVFRGLGWLAYQSGLAHVQLASQSFAGAQTWDQLDEMARYAYRSSPGIVAQGVLGMVNWDGSDVLRKINVPTLIISGDQDVTTLPAASDRMQHDIPSATRLSVSPAAHMGPVEQYQHYAGAIAAFAQRQ